MRLPIFHSAGPSPQGDASAGRAEPTQRHRDKRDVASLSRVLNQALRVAELAVLSCKREYHIALRHRCPPLAAAALEHANDSKLHADRIRQRIVELGGKPDAPPDGPHRSRIRSAQGDSVAATVTEHLIASRAAAESYSETAAFFAPFDDDTRKLMDDIATEERERGDDLARLQRDTTQPQHQS
jgi:bacterioferritin